MNSQAISRLVRLALAIMHRFRPPLRIGMNIASVSRPSSGSWNATLVKVAPLKKRPGISRLKASTTATSSANRPTAVPSGRNFR